MSDKIKLLSEIVANQIAAGEVVNRPSSVVKEMMENAIDAGATSVTVNFRDGGKDLIQVVDNGCGMSPIDARMAFDRHATSKISSVDDIYALNTFGFRGEALASIAAVSQIELKTRQEGDGIGVLTEVNGGEFVAQKPIMCSVGAQFYVRNLFYNVPARRRFLEKTTTSTSHIKAEFQRISLCYPKINFELFSNDVSLYNLTSTTLPSRIVDVIGKHIKQNLLEVSANTSIAKISGYVGRPAAAKKRNYEQYLFVNGRYFTSSYINKAIVKAYEKLIPESCFPSYFIYLTIEPDRIDVNVHPQKTEVKFADEEAVWQIVHAAVRETLAKTGAVPMMNFDDQGEVEIPTMTKGVVYQEPATVSNIGYNPFERELRDRPSIKENLDFGDFDLPNESTFNVSGDKLYGSAIGLSDDFSDFNMPDINPLGAFRSEVHAATSGVSDTFKILSSKSSLDSDGDILYSSAIGSGDLGVSNHNSIKIEDKIFYGNSIDNNLDFENSELDFIASEYVSAEQLSLIESDSKPTFLNIISVGGGYVVAMMNGRLVFVDMQRVRERIIFDSCMVMLGNGLAVSQQLLFPEKLQLSSDEYSLMEDNAVDFASLGFDVEYMGDDSIEVRGLPADMPSSRVDELIYDLLRALEMPVDIDIMRRERIALVMAKGGSRVASKIANIEEVERLLEELVGSSNFSFSPSGKAIMVEMTVADMRLKLG